MKNNEYQELAKLLFPSVTENVDDLLKKYPQRNCTALRFAPSPTGYLHIGSLGMTIINSRIAKATGGICFLRIEDTDQKREIEGATELLVAAIKQFGINFDEGFDGQKNFGKYGPYVQSKRIEIYNVFAKSLVELGYAYPCFCSEEQLDKLREQQNETKQKTGYYGEYAICRNLDINTIKENIKNKKPWALRFNPGEVAGQRITWKDMIRGEMSLPAEQNHPVIIKSNGIPPYNFAHVVDDTLMRTSHVVRGEEWLVSTAQHIQIFNAFGLKYPHYAHPPVICVEENGSKRKLSKRKDKEAIVQNFLDAGYPAAAILEYLMTLYNTDFEMWRIKNPDSPNTDFTFKFEKIGSNSPLFDWNKLDNISKNIIAKMTCKQINEEVKKFFSGQSIDLEKVYAILAIDRESPKPRKDIVKYTDIPVLYSYLFKDEGKANATAREYAKIYNHTDSKEQWFARIKAATDNARDYTAAIRQALTGRENSPDLYVIMQILGEQEVLKRLSKS